jgi:excisionase family DNA binding protein
VSATAPQLLTTEQVAARLGICTETVLRRLRRGEIKSLKIDGRQYRVSEVDLAEYVESLRVEVEA